MPISRRIDKYLFAQKSGKQSKYLDNMLFLTSQSSYVNLVHPMDYALQLWSQSISRRSRNPGGDRVDGMRWARCLSPIKEWTSLPQLELTSKLVGCCRISTPTLSLSNLVCSFCILPT